MSIKLSECDYDYLIPPKDVFNVTHSDHYIRHGEGKKSIRKVFRNVNFQPDELAKLKEFEALIAKENIQLPSDWTTVDNMRYMYAGKWDFKKALKMLKHHFEWRASPDRGVITPGGYKLMEEGIIYISGRDKQYRPIIVVNVYKVDLKKTDMKDIISAICFVLDTVKKFYFVPGKVENWIIIIETNGAGLFNFPIKMFKTINDVTAGNYTSTLEKLYVMNPSSFLKKSWSFASGFVDPETADKINFMTKSELHELNKTIDPDQLESIYGGTLPTPSVYWPPVNTLGQPPYTEGIKLDIEIATTKALGILPDIDEILGLNLNEPEKQSKPVTANAENPTSPEKQHNSQISEISPVRGSAAMSVPSQDNSIRKKENEVIQLQSVTLVSPEKRKSVLVSPPKEKQTLPEVKALQEENKYHHARGITELLADQQLMQEVSVRKLSSQAVNNGDEEAFKGNSNMNKGLTVNVKKGNDTNDVSNMSGSGFKNLKSATDGEIIFEGSTDKSHFCGFCKSKSSSNNRGEESTCNLF